MSCGDGQKKSPYSSVYEHSGNYRAAHRASKLGVTVGELMAGEKSAAPQPEAPTTEQVSSEHRAECLAAAIRSMLEGAGLEPDRLGTEQELRTKLGDDPPPPDPHRLPRMNSGLPALLMTFGFAFVWESFVVRQGDRGGD